MQFMSRCGQTAIYSQLHFKIGPRVMGATKLHDQKAILLTMHLMSLRPDFVLGDVFGRLPGAMLANRGDNILTQSSHDEIIEQAVGMIKGLSHAKNISTLFSNTGWSGAFHRLRTKLRNSLFLGDHRTPNRELKWDERE